MSFIPLFLWQNSIHNPNEHLSNKSSQLLAKQQEFHSLVSLFQSAKNQQDEKTEGGLTIVGSSDNKDLGGQEAAQ